MANGEVDSSGSLWQIPVSIVQAGSSQVTQVMLNTPSMETRLTGVQPGDWVKLNPEFVGFYRVAYGKEELEQLCSAVKSMSLPYLDRQMRSCLISDVLPVLYSLL
jgi:aminopeptidase N